MANPQIISGDTLVSSAATRNEAQEITGLQRIGKDLALWILIITTIVIVGLGFFWYTHSPLPPQLTLADGALNEDGLAAAENLMQQYKLANDIALEGTRELFDAIVGKMLFPLLTAIIGYIFGRQSLDTGGDAS